MPAIFIVLIVLTALVFIVLGYTLIKAAIKKEKEKEKEKEKKKEELPSLPSITVEISSVVKIQNFIEDIGNEMVKRGEQDALSNLKMEDGIAAIRADGIQRCKKEIGNINRDEEFIGYDKQIQEFEKLGQTVNAEERRISKEQRTIEISEIKDLQKELETNENLPCIASYKKGFLKAKSEQIAAMANKNRRINNE
jgi:hypothetical protein